MTDGASVRQLPAVNGRGRRRRRLGLALMAGVSATAFAAPALAQSGTASSYSQQILNFANAVDNALHGSGGSGATAYSHEYAERGIDEHPQVNLSTNQAPMVVTDCSGWVNYTLNTVAPVHHALLNDSRKAAPFAALGEKNKPWARAMVLQHYFNQMPVVGSSDTSQGFQQITDFGATSGDNSLQPGDVVAYCEGGWCTPTSYNGDTGHTFVVTETPVEIKTEADYASTFASHSKGRSGDETLGKLLSDPELRVFAVKVVDSSTLTHYSDDRSFASVPQSVKEAYPTEFGKGELSKGGLGSGYILLAVDSSGRVRQTRFADGDQWLPNNTSGSAGTDEKMFGAVRLTNSIALSSQLTVTKWSNTLNSFGGVEDLGEIAVAISGSNGSILLNGGGTLHLTGSNSYGAGTTVTDASTLVINNDGNLGISASSLTLSNGTLQVADGFTSSGRQMVIDTNGGTLRTTGTGGSATWSGPVSGNGALTVARGHWTFDGFGTGYGGDLSIADSAHVTVASGTTFSGTATVNQGGTLSGGGRVGNLTNHGTVAPGSSNTLTTSGGYTQSSGGTLTIGLASASRHAKLVANGPANLDGTLKAELAGSYVPEVDASFKIIESSGVNGQFSTVDAQFSQTLTGAVSYGTTGVTLTATRDYDNDRLHDKLKDPDLRGVAKALNERAHVRSGATHAALSAIDRLTQSSHAGEALHQLKPHNPSHHATTAIATSKGHSKRISTRLNGLRGATGGDGGTASGLSAGGPFSSALAAGGTALAGTLYQLAADPQQVDPGRMAPVGVMDAGQGGLTADRPIGVFAYGTGLLGYQDTTSDREGYRFDGGGLTIGMDYRLNDRIVVGLAGSYAQTRTTYQGGSDVSDAETWSAGPYAMFTDGPLYLEGVASYSWSSYDNSRTVNLGTYSAVSNSSPDGSQYSFYAGGGYDFDIAPGTTLGPTASLQYTRGEIDGYTETGSNPFNLTVDSQSMTSLQSNLGARLRGSFDGDWGRVLPELRLGWSHEFDNDATTVTSQLSGGTIPFTATGDDPVRDWVTVGAEVALQLNGSTSLFASTDAQMAFSRENAALSASAGVRVAF